MLVGYQDTWWQSLLGILIPSAGVDANREMVISLSFTIGQSAEGTARRFAAQQTSLNSLAQEY